MQRLNIPKVNLAFILFPMAPTNLTGLKLRAGSYPHIARLDEMSRGHMIADLVTVISTMDVVFGEVDR